MPLLHATALVAVLLIIALSAGYAAVEKAADLERDASAPQPQQQQARTSF